jgi:F-type H+-transporting ATPase subunit delta
MTDEILVKRYGDAFIEHAKEHIGLDRAIEDLQGIRGVFRENPVFEGFLKFPDIERSEKYAVIDRVLDGQFSEEAVYFLKLLINNGRIGMFVEIAEYARVTYSFGVVKEAVLRTTYPLDTGIIEKIRDGMEKLLSSKLHFYIELDPSLLGGVSVQVGNIIYDGSVRKRLEEIKEKLSALKVA